MRAALVSGWSHNIHRCHTCPTMLWARISLLSGPQTRLSTAKTVFGTIPNLLQSISAHGTQTRHQRGGMQRSSARDSLRTYLVTDADRLTYGIFQHASMACCCRRQRCLNYVFERLTKITLNVIPSQELSIVYAALTNGCHRNARNTPSRRINLHEEKKVASLKVGAYHVTLRHVRTSRH